MEYQEWVETVPGVIRQDSLWKVQAYRMSLYASDLGWEDVTLLAADRRTVKIADQLYRACGSIGSNIAEGYSRGTGRDRARFYEYALGSARETRDWYYKGRFVLGTATSNQRLELCSRIIKLLLVMVPDQRASTIREDPAEYDVD